MKLEKKQLDEERQEQLKQRTKLELNVKDLEDGVKEDAHLKTQGTKELEQLELVITENEEKLAQILPVYQEKKSSEEDCKARYFMKKKSDLY